MQIYLFIKIDGRKKIIYVTKNKLYKTIDNYIN